MRDEENGKLAMVGGAGHPERKARSDAGAAAAGMALAPPEPAGEGSASSGYDAAVTTVTCPHCHRETPSFSKFCLYCGDPIDTLPDPFGDEPDHDVYYSDLHKEIFSSTDQPPAQDPDDIGCLGRLAVGLLGVGLISVLFLLVLLLI